MVERVIPTPRGCVRAAVVVEHHPLHAFQVGLEELPALLRARVAVDVHAKLHLVVLQASLVRRGHALDGPLDPPLWRVGRLRWTHGPPLAEKPVAVFDGALHLALLDQRVSPQESRDLLEVHLAAIVGEPWGVAPLSFVEVLLVDREKVIQTSLPDLGKWQGRQEVVPNQHTEEDDVIDQSLEIEHERQRRSLGRLKLQLQVLPQ
mmetsp:Transcript_106602/g.267222  ORF Transcript_106602/g.267222 Transcript_106602/m.267222 type:complete len:205 (-) Transcript_106602:840-1454(-)